MKSFQILDPSMLPDIHEFLKRYEGTYLHFEFTPGKPELLYVCGLADKDRVISLEQSRYGEFGGSYKLWDVHEPITVKTAWPSPGNFQDEDRVWRFARYPDRQWKRGISPKNSRFYDPILTGLTNEFQDPPPFSRLLQLALNKPATTHTISGAAMVLLNSPKMISYLVDHNFLVSQPFAKEELSSEVVYLWYKSYLIGKVSLPRNNIHLFNRNLQQEVQDLVDKENVYWRISV